jgi:hypothetical protein
MTDTIIGAPIGVGGAIIGVIIANIMEHRHIAKLLLSG